jgi:predicted Zn-dependent peptidase
METNTGQSSTIGYYYTITGGTDFLDNYLARLDAITPQDVSRIAKQYFSADPISIVVEPQNSLTKGAA